MRRRRLAGSSQPETCTQITMRGEELGAEAEEAAGGGGRGRRTRRCGRGAGGGVELTIQLYRWVHYRATCTTNMHSVGGHREVQTQSDGAKTVQANLLPPH